MRKMRAKRAAELDLDEEKHWLKERLQIQKLWKGKKEQKEMKKDYGKKRIQTGEKGKTEKIEKGS